MKPFRPARVSKSVQFNRLTSGGDEIFVALSSIGELYTFSVSNNESMGKGIKAQRVQALRKEMGTVKVADLFIGVLRLSIC